MPKAINLESEFQQLLAKKRERESRNFTYKLTKILIVILAIQFKIWTWPFVEIIQIIGIALMLAAPYFLYLYYTHK